MIQTALSRRRKQGFTLIELLVVMAITVILLGLIFGPLVQGFNLTNRARVQVLTQDSARRVMETVQRDLSNAVFTFDNSNEPLNFWVRNSDNQTVAVQVPYALIDLVPPARAEDQNAQLNQSDIDPTTGLALNRGNIALPLAPGRVIIRYWLGLADNKSLGNKPVRTYANYYDDYSDPRFNLGRNDHNPYVLYRAVISPYLPDGQVDTRLFKKDQQGRPILYDPNFYYDTAQVVAPSGIPAAVPGWKDQNEDGYVNLCENWAAVARAIVPPDRADQIVLERDDRRRVLFFNNLPRVTALARFQPTFVGNDSGQPTSQDDPGNESPNIAPGTYTAKNGHWTRPYRLYVFRTPFDATILKYFLEDGSGAIRYQEYDTSTNTTTVDDPVDFNLDANGQLPLGSKPKIMFTVDTRRGLANFAFPDSILLHDTMGNPQPSQFDPEAVNQRFDSAYANQENAYRYVSLADLDTALNPGVKSPLTEIPDIKITPGAERVTGPDMRPGPHHGKEIAYTRLANSTAPQEVGPNEYKINYTDVGDPNVNPNLTDDERALLKMGTIVFDCQVDGQNQPVVHSLPLTDADGNPAAKITVTYQIQNNAITDVIKADYLTRQLMTFALSVRLYDVNSGQPQQVTLTQKIKVRNLQR